MDELCKELLVKYFFLFKIVDHNLKLNQQVIILVWHLQTEDGSQQDLFFMSVRGVLTENVTGI